MADSTRGSEHSSYENCMKYYSEYYLEHSGYRNQKWTGLHYQEFQCNKCIAAAITVLHCPVIWDIILCWPPTKAGVTAKQLCPESIGNSSRRHAYRTCSPKGVWEGYPSVPWGFTNYSECPSVNEVSSRLLKLNKDRESVITTGWTIEKIGLSVSLIALVISLVLIFKSRSLKHGVARLQKNLFFAMLLEVVLRLVVYIDREVNGTYLLTGPLKVTNTPWLCQACYILMEYSRTVMFVWMFIDSLFLQNLVTKDKPLKEYLKFYACSLAAWGAPVVFTIAWAITMLLKHDIQRCLRGYSYSPLFWILEGPRLLVIIANFIALLNVVRTLIMKSELSTREDIKQARKTLMTAMILLPLLAVNDIPAVARITQPKTTWEFRMVTYTFRAFKGSQGFFMALFFCFLRPKVQNDVTDMVAYCRLRILEKYSRFSEENNEEGKSKRASYRKTPIVRNQVTV